jgi:hypothetical protein
MADHEVTEAGVPLYPGSETTGHDMKLDLGFQKQISCVRTTQDSVAQVHGFYRALLPDAEAALQGDVACLNQKLPNRNMLTVVATKDKKVTRVVIASGPRL